MTSTQVQLQMACHCSPTARRYRYRYALLSPIQLPPSMLLGLCSLHCCSISRFSLRPQFTSRPWASNAAVGFHSDSELRLQAPKRSVAGGYEQQRVQQLEQINQGLEERLRTLESSRRPQGSIPSAGAVPTAFSQVSRMRPVCPLSPFPRGV